MIYKFHGYGYIKSFIFKCYSYEAAESFICSLCDRFSPNPRDGSDWVGNYISILSIYGDGYKPQFNIEKV